MAEDEKFKVNKKRKCKDLPSHQQFKFLTSIHIDLVFEPLIFQRLV